MRRLSLLAFVVVLIVGIGAVVVYAAGRSTDQVQTVGVLPVSPVAPLRPGDEACQSPIALAGPLERVRFNVSVGGKLGTPFEVTVRDPHSGAALASGRLAPGWIDNGKPQVVAVGHVAARRFVAVCIRNRGPIEARIFGDVNVTGKAGAGPLAERPTSSTSSATIDGRPIAGDLSMSFVSRGSRSVLSLVPEMFRRAALFRPGWVGAWTFWVLLACVVLLVPALLWRALRLTPEELDAPSSPAPHETTEPLVPLAARSERDPSGAH